MVRKPTLNEAIAAAPKTSPAGEPRKVKPASKRDRPTFDTSASSGRVWSPTELAAVIAFISGRERAAGRMEADPDDVLEAEKLRDLRGRVEMREDERDLQRKKLIEAELAIVIYHDDCAQVSSYLRGMGARLMQTLAVEDSAEAACRIIQDDVEQALANLAEEHVDPTSAKRHPYLGGTEIPGRS